MKNTSARFLWPATSILAITDMTKSCFFPFAGTLGGHLGLFLGASILSITELTELLLLLLLRCFGCLRGTRRRTERSDTQSKTDGSVAVATVSWNLSIFFLFYFRIFFPVLFVGLFCSFSKQVVVKPFNFFNFWGIVFPALFVGLFCCFSKQVAVTTVSWNISFLLFYV